MKHFAFLFAFVAVACLLAPKAVAQEEQPLKIVEEGKDFFAKKKWAKALNKFKLALQVGVKEEAALEIALHIGAIYAEIGQSDLARQNLLKYLTKHPTTSVPATFTEKMAAALEEVRKEFPIVRDIRPEKETFKPYKEKISITFTVSAAETVIEKITVTFKILAEARTEVILEAPVKLDPTAPFQRALWDGKSKYGRFVENGDYVFVVEAAREDGWYHSSQRLVRVDGNLGTPEVTALQKKARRVGSITGQRHIDYLPERQFVKIGVEPLKPSMKGFWNYVYYIPIGAIRDGLDFPVKYLLSLKGIGHVMTVTSPFAGGYAIGRSLWKIDKDDYIDPMLGFDKASWDHDKKAVDQRTLASGVLGPVWALAYAGVMSIVSWAGTEDGIGKGFTSYINSNVYKKGYDSKYFFPNYRSLDFSVAHVDKKELARLEAKVSKINSSIENEIRLVNLATDRFNATRLHAFKRAIAAKHNQELYDRAEMTVKAK